MKNYLDKVQSLVDFNLKELKKLIDNEHRKTIVNNHFALKLGYQISFNNKISFMYVKGIINIWKIREGFIKADLINNHFCNHKKYKNLKLALKNNQ